MYDSINPRYYYYFKLEYMWIERDYSFICLDLINIQKISLFFFYQKKTIMSICRKVI